MIEKTFHRSFFTGPDKRLHSSSSFHRHETYHREISRCSIDVRKYRLRYNPGFRGVRSRNESSLRQNTVKYDKEFSTNILLDAERMIRSEKKKETLESVTEKY